MASNLPTGYQAGFIAVEVEGDGDTHYWVLDQTQMDEVELIGNKVGSDYCEAMNTVVDKYNLWNSGLRFATITAALEYMLSQKIILIEDFSYLTY